MNKTKQFFNPNYPEFDNIKDFIKYTVEKYPNNVAFKIKEKEEKQVNFKSITFSEYLEMINNLGEAFYKKGLQEKRIVVVGKNRYEWMLTYVATLMGNMVTVPIDKGLTETELQTSIERVEPAAIVFDSTVKDVVLKYKEDSKLDIQYFYMEEKESLEGIESIYDLIEIGKKEREHSQEFENCEIDANKCSELCFTSGTSAQSKIVMLSHKNIVSNVSGLNAQENLNEHDVNLAFLPMHHTFGSTGTLFIFSYGAQTVFPDGLKYIAQNLKEYGVTVFIGVPLLLDSMYKKVEKELKKQNKEKLVKVMRKVTNICPAIKRKVFKQVIDALGGKLRFVVSGAAALDKEVGIAFNELGITIVQGYGLTECSPVIAGENERCHKLGSVGPILRGIDVKILNKNELGIGEIAVKGPNVMLGYYNNEEANKATFTEDGYLLTGDLGYIDPQGYLFISGRSKNVIVLKNGKNVYPEEIEAMVNRIPGVKESMVFGLPKEDDEDDTVLSVKVQYDEEYMNTNFPNMKDEEISKNIWEKIKELNKTMPTYKYIKNLITTKEDFIKTTTAKIKRYEEMKKIRKNKDK